MLAFKELFKLEIEKDALICIERRKCTISTHRVIRVLSLPRRGAFINRLQWKENSGGVDIYDETTTKEIARQARSPAINNAVQTVELASVNNSKKNTNTVEINVSSLTSRDQNPVSLLNSIVSLGYSLSLSFSLPFFSGSNSKIAAFFSP